MIERLLAATALFAIAALIVFVLYVWLEIAIPQIAEGFVNLLGILVW